MNNTRPRETTRLAPSPTGALHLGNARTFLINWALARQDGWRIILRIEDLDGPRNKPGAERDAIEILTWLGIDWDEGPFRQSGDLSPYEAAMDQLGRRALVYPCSLSRGEIEAAASAPHLPEPATGHAVVPHESHYPAQLRPPLVTRPFAGGDDGFGEPTNWRFVCPPDTVRFQDRFAGVVEFTPAQTVGDFVLWTKRREPAYQLAVTVDDDRQGITRIVRGDDLLESAARQILLRRALSLPERIEYIHLPLIVGPDGRRLAKRHGDTRVVSYRDIGVHPERIIGLIAAWSGVLPRECYRPMSAGEFANALNLDTVPRQSITFTPHDEAWLQGEQ